MPKYGAAARRSHVLRTLKDRGHVSVNDLSEDLSVSTVTIRKDLQYLEDRNLLTRTHGGAIAAHQNQYAANLPLENLPGDDDDAGRELAQQAADLVENKDTLILDSGAATLQVARNLRNKSQITVATPSVHIAQELLRLSDATVLMIGGRLQPSSASTVGPYAEKMLREHSFRKVFFTGDGFDAAFGLTTATDAEAELNRLMVKSAEEAIALIDMDALGRREFSLVCRPSDLDTVVTNAALPGEASQQLTEQGVNVLSV